MKRKKKNDDKLNLLGKVKKDQLCPVKKTLVWKYAEIPHKDATSTENVFNDLVTSWPKKIQVTLFL